MSPYRSTSAWTGRASRTMAEAFGPYTSYEIERPRRNPLVHWLVWAAVCLVLLGCMAWMPR